MSQLWSAAAERSADAALAGAERRGGQCAQDLPRALRAPPKAACRCRFPHSSNPVRLLSSGAAYDAQPAAGKKGGRLAFAKMDETGGMTTSFQLNADELDATFVERVKATFPHKLIEIVVTEADETASLLADPARRAAVAPGGG